MSLSCVIFLCVFNITTCKNIRSHWSQLSLAGSIWLFWCLFRSLAFRKVFHKFYILASSVHRMLRLLLLLLLLLLRQVFTSSQSQICWSVRFRFVHFFICHWVSQPGSLRFKVIDQAITLSDFFCGGWFFDEIILQQHKCLNSDKFVVATKQIG